MKNHFFNKNNYVLMSVGLGLLVLGYILLAQKPVNGFLTLNAAPILLTLTYCVFFPVAIMWNKKDKVIEGKKEEKGA